MIGNTNISADKPTDEPNPSAETPNDEIMISDSVMEVFAKLMSFMDLLSDLDDDEMAELHNIIFNEDVGIKDMYHTINNLRGGI